MSHWFFAPPGSWSDDFVTLPPDEARHASRVLRLERGDPITVADGRGTVAKCILKDDAGHLLTARIEARQERRRPLPEIVVYQGAAKKGKLDDVVEKLGELGVAEMHAFESERSVARWDASKAEKLDMRWETIARSAGKQSRNPFFLQPSAGLPWTALLEKVSAESFAVTLWEEASLPLRSALVAQATRVAIVVGPEGGFTASEVEALAEAGAPPVSLGPSILRTENAPVVTASLLLYHYGLLG